MWYGPLLPGGAQLAGVAALNADLAVTEADDTLSAASTAALAASLTVTEADDTLSAVGAVALAANLTVTEADDTLSSDVASGAGRTASFDVTEADDTLSAEGAVALVASLTVTEADDTSAEAVAPPAEEADSLLDAKFQGSPNVRFRPIRNPRSAAVQVIEQGDICVSSAVVTGSTARGVGLLALMPLPAPPKLRPLAPAPVKRSVAQPAAPAPVVVPHTPVVATPLPPEPAGPTQTDLAVARVAASVSDVSDGVAALAGQNKALREALSEVLGELAEMRAEFRAYREKQDIAAENKRRAAEIASRLSPH